MKGNDPEKALLARALAMYAGDHVLAYVRAKGDGALIAAQEWVAGTMMFIDAAPISPPPMGVLPDQMPEWRREYLGLLSEAILGGGGTLDTISGEFVTAWWAGKDPRANAIGACDAAVEMARAMPPLNELANDRGYLRVLLRIGIASGPFEIGPYGSAQRLRFGALGEVVNIAYRLCYIARAVDKSQILICDATRTLLPATIRSDKASLEWHQSSGVWPANVLRY